MLGTGLKCEYSVGDAIVQAIIWAVITTFTLGLALIVLPYYFLKGPINKTFVVDQSGQKLARLHVEVHLTQIIGHLLFWLFLSIITLGLAYLVYWPAVMKKMLSGAKYIPIGSGPISTL